MNAFVHALLVVPRYSSASNRQRSGSFAARIGRCHAKLHQKPAFRICATWYLNMVVGARRAISHYPLLSLGHCVWCCYERSILVAGVVGLRGFRTSRSTHARYTPLLSRMLPNPSIERTSTGWPNESSCCTRSSRRLNKRRIES
jgi:hypothetical protein